MKKTLTKLAAKVREYKRPAIDVQAKVNLKSLLGDDDDDAPQMEIKVIHDPKGLFKPSSTKKPNVRALLEDNDDVEARLPASPPTPEGFFSITPGGTDDRCVIIDTLNARWDELYIYNFRMESTLHMRRADLFPREQVDAAVIYLQQLKSSR